VGALTSISVDSSANATGTSLPRPPETSSQWLFEEQVRRWRALELDDVRRAKVEELAGKVARLREVNAAVLALAVELKKGTIERVLAMSDLELGLVSLLRRAREP
jgi:hypothetical protein